MFDRIQVFVDVSIVFIYLYIYTNTNINIHSIGLHCCNLDICILMQVADARLLDNFARFFVLFVMVEMCEVLVPLIYMIVPRMATALTSVVRDVKIC